MPLKSFITLNTKTQMPTLGLGTWPTDDPHPGEMRGAIQFALSHGYKLIDTAPANRNEKEVGLGFVLVGEEKGGQRTITGADRQTPTGEPMPVSEAMRSEHYALASRVLAGPGTTQRDMLAHHASASVKPTAVAQARPGENSLVQSLTSTAARDPAGFFQTPIRRDSFFLIAKLDNADHKDVMESLRTSLQKLRTSYVDLWLMHWPAPMTKDGKADKQHDWLDTWRSMEDLYLANPRHIKAIGVANFSLEYLERLMANCRVVPAVNKMELHPACNQRELVDYCTEKGIAVIGYWPLGSGDQRLLTHPVVLRVADTHKVSPENVLISFQANRPNVAVLVKGVDPSMIQANSKLIELSDSETEGLYGISRSLQFRVRSPEWTGWGDLGFHDVEENVVSGVDGSQHGSAVTGGSPTPMEGVINES